MRNALRTAAAVTIIVMLAGALAGCELVSRELKPEEAVALALQATESVKTAEFDLKMEMETGGIPTAFTGSGAIELPTSFEVSGTMTTDTDSIPSQQRMIDGTQYLRSPALGDGWWVEEVSVPDIRVVGAGDPKEYFAYFDAVENTEDFGMQRIRGTECRHLLLEIDEVRLGELLGSADSWKGREAIETSTMRVDVWIARETGLPMREVVKTTMQLPGTPESTPTHLVAQIDFTAFDTSVEIVVPTGAKPMPAVGQQ